MMNYMGRRAHGYENCERPLLKLRATDGVPDELKYIRLINICSLQGWLDRALKMGGEMKDVRVGMLDRFAWMAEIDGCAKDGR